MISRRLGAVVTAAVAVVALAGCGGDSSSSPKASGAGGDCKAAGTTISIKGFAYSPSCLTVKPGAEIVVTNEDSTAHTITSSDGTSFDSKSLSQNKTYTVKAPAKAGKYTYVCTFHQYMKGTLTVS